MKSPRNRSPGDDDAIEAMAAAWLAQKDESFTPADEKAFNQWRGADIRHEAAVVRLEGTWRNLVQLRNFRPNTRRHPDCDLLLARTARSKTSVPWLAMAAAAAVTLAFIWWWPVIRSIADPSPLASAPPRSSPAATQSFATSTDGFQRVVLEDGSIVELNANTAIKVQYTPQERRLELTRGEAQFTVTKNHQRPFWVKVGAVSVRAVGTAFDVRLEKGMVEVLVTEGRVRVTNATPATKNGRAPSAPGEEVSFLDAGSRAVIMVGDQSTPVMEKLDPPVIRELLAWQAPKLVFLGMPLAQVASEFNRSNRVQLVIADPELSTLPIGGSFRAENVEAFVRLLAADNHIAVERPDADHIVLRKAPR